MTTYALGHYFRLLRDDDTIALALQNFFISSTVAYEGNSYTFSPFGFSGTSTSRQGDLDPILVTFPNNPLARGYLSDALRGMSYNNNAIDERPWKRPFVGEVDVCLVDPENRTVTNRLFKYTGQCTSGGWDDTVLTLELSSILDAVTADVPTRTLIQRQVGSLPISSSVRLN